MAIFGAGPVLLDTPETMLAVLQELRTGGTWRGMIDVWDMDDGEGGQVEQWRLEMNNDLGGGDGNTVTALRGQYLHLTYGRLLVLNADEV